MKLKDFYANCADGWFYGFALLGAYAVLMRFMYWMIIETANETCGFWIWFFRILFALGLFGLGMLVYFFAIRPIREYTAYKNRIKWAAISTHWSGGLDKALRDLGKAYRDNNEKSIQQSAKIFMKEVQVALLLNPKCIYEVERTLEGFCVALRIDDVEEIKKSIELRLMTCADNQYDYIELQVGVFRFTRNLFQVD